MYPKMHPCSTPYGRRINSASMVILLVTTGVKCIMITGYRGNGMRFEIEVSPIYYFADMYLKMHPCSTPYGRTINSASMMILVVTVVIVYN
ncbi:unnamed protein product, partial [Callosobruchus maculatus]